MTVKKRGGRWHFSFQIKGVRYREAIPEARTKFQAEQPKLRRAIRYFRAPTARCNLATKTLANS